MKITLLYLAMISVVSIIVTIHDKNAAKNKQLRVSEKTLLTICALGGSFAMLVTMLMINHKTKKRKFTVGIPIIIALQFVFTLYIYAFLRR